MGMFKEGDRVRVRRDLVAISDGGPKVRYFNLDPETYNRTDVGDVVITSMVSLAGKECMIASVRSSGKYKLVGSDEWWTDEMFELAECMPNTFRMWETKTFA